MATFKANLSFLRELFALKEVMDAGQIQGAARRNGIKQSNLSKIISDLETELNTPLLNRSSKGVEPTNTARLLYTDIESIVKSLDKISAEFSDAEELTGCVTVFVEDGFLGSRLLKEMSLFYAMHLNIRLDIVTDKHVSLSDVDLAIFSDIPSDIKGKILFKSESKMHLYSSEAYLARHGVPKNMADLLENFDLCVQQRHLEDEFSRLLLKKAKHLNTTSDSESVIFRLVYSGDGVGLLHDWLACDKTNLVCLKTCDFEVIRTFFGVCSPAAEKTAKIKALIQHLRVLSETGAVDDLEFF